MARGPAGKEGSGVKKGTWTAEEDRKLVAYVTKYGCWNWRQIPKFAGLARCGKSCRLRWLNYLRPDVKRGDFTQQEDHTIIKLHQNLGNRWSKIAAHLPGRSDNEIKNHWHTNLKKKHYSSQQIDQCMQNTHTTTSEESDASQASSSSSNNNNNNNSNSQISNISSSMCSNSNLVVEDYYYNNYDDEELLGFESALFIEPTTHNFWTHPYMLDDDISYHYSNQTPQDFASLTHPQLWPHNLDHFDQYSAFF